MFLLAEGAEENKESCGRAIGQTIGKTCSPHMHIQTRDSMKIEVNDQQSISQ